MKPSEVPDDRTPGTEPREHFEGHDGRECGEHRTCGHRAWCFDCSEWCYPTIPCRGCELPKLRAALTAREEPTMPEPADRPSLRDQIAQAMRDANGTPEALAAWQRHPQLVPVDVYADAVLPVVEAETAALRQRAEEAEVERDVAVTSADPFKIERVKSLTAAMTRLVTTERDDARKRAEEAEGAVQRVRDLAASLQNPDAPDVTWHAMGQRILLELDQPKETR